MATSDIELLRRYINDPVPTNGDDPEYPNEILQDALDRANGDPEKAAAEVWRWKAAEAAALVDVSEGNASRAMSDMQGHALNMVKHFEGASPGPTEGRTTIGRIRRRYR